MSQSRIILDFESKVLTLNQSSKDSIIAKLANQKVKEINLTSVIKQSATISKDRINSEWRLIDVKNFLLTQNVPSNRISSQIIIETDSADIKEDQLLMNISYDEMTTGLVLKKTPTVQISLIEFEQKKEVALVPEKKEVAEPATPLEKKLLNVEEFKKDNLITLTNLLFESGLHLIIPSSRQVLLELLDIMRTNPKLQIELQGHICCRKYGLDGYDPVSRRENLSEMRAKTVYNFLVNQGIAPERMSFKGFGSSRKLQDDSFDPVAAQRNRRVEVLITAVE